MAFCTSCGATMDPSASVCPACGKAVGGAAAPAPAAAAAPAQSAPKSGGALKVIVHPNG